MTNLLIALVELIEAEGRSLRKETIEVGFRLGALFFAGVLFAAGVAMFGWAVYQYLLTIMSASLAALLMGSVAILLGGGVIWQIRRSYQ